MIKLKTEVNKSKLIKELSTEANKIYKESWQPEYTIKAFMDGAQALFKLLRLPDVVSSSDLIVVELSDEEIKIITRQELEQWQKSAIEFDGFEAWIVRGRLVR